MNRGISRESSYTRMINENGDLQQPNKLHCKQSKQENMGLNQQNGTEPTTIQHCNMCRSPTKKQKTVLTSRIPWQNPKLNTFNSRMIRNPGWKLSAGWHDIPLARATRREISVATCRIMEQTQMIGYISRFLMFGHIVQTLGPLTCQVLFLTHKTTLTAHALLPVSPFALYVLSQPDCLIPSKIVWVCHLSDCFDRWMKLLQASMRWIDLSGTAWSSWHFITCVSLVSLWLVCLNIVWTPTRQLILLFLSFPNSFFGMPNWAVFKASLITSWLSSLKWAMLQALCHPSILPG